ncbi:formyltransferase family protein [Fluviispira multicolorata]|uniref:Formyl transferase N-terminal domain-containing protein n=1 Tax=Fluviispira multicolorata TaxID=2654512 RepID=A0A833N385_9BACT|nr:formyltransferase family protein [Fluviispira multicolorata]KAB8028014.1 hypothetical protein GCL57_13245 [Fluviispira multicolorata]
MKNLIFVSKYIGLECLKFHLEKYINDYNYIVVSDPEKEQIINYLKINNIQYIDIDNFSINNLMNEKFDWLLNLWGGYIFKHDILERVHNSLNIHPSFLPFGRGRDPVVWAIRNRSPAGVTLHEINNQVDGGDIWYQEEVPYTLPITGNNLYQKVINSCITIFKIHWPKIRDKKYIKRQQDTHNLPTFKRKDLFSDQIINFKNLNSEQIDIILKILAHDFDKNYSALLIIDKEKFKIRFHLEKVDTEGI